MSMNQVSRGTADAPRVSLLQDGASLCERLGDVEGRLLKLGDVLHGSQPRELLKALGDKPPDHSARRNLDNAIDFVNRIEEELQRIESRL